MGGELHISEEALPEEQLLATFKALDMDGSGQLTHDEFNNLMRCGSHLITGEEAWIDSDALQQDAAYAEQERQALLRPPRCYHDRFRRGPPLETAAQQAASRVYNRGGVHVRSDPFVAALDRKGHGFQKT